MNYSRIVLGLILAMTIGLQPSMALDKPTGAPLELSAIETEQAVPLTFIDPDGKSAHCASVKLHWNPIPDVGPKDEATSFEIDIAADSPGASIFLAQLWKASLASAEAWQMPWQGARWKVLQTPATDGTGINAALAVGMIATSARRPYPPKTAVIAGLNPDGSLGAVSRLSDRLKAAADAGMTKVIIPSAQKQDTDASGQVINLVKQATDLHLECVPADNLVDATEAVMNDPLPEVTPGPEAPKYSNQVSNYIEDFAHREQNETTFNLKFAPKEENLAKYPPRLAAIWRSVYADMAAGQKAFASGQVYVAYRLFSRANANMNGVNALTGQNRANFDVKAALAESDDLRNRLHGMMNPPSIDKGELQSALLVAEMADWAYEINAALQGAQLVTKQTFSQRTDATDAEKDRAREAILVAIEQGKYLMNHADFFYGLLPRIGKDNPIPVDENAAHLLPQLIPAQLATARIFTEGIRQRANDLRDGLLFDPDLVAYVNILRETKAEWESRQRKKEMDAQAAAEAEPAAVAQGDNKGAVKLNSNAGPSAPVFDPGDTFKPPHNALAPTTPVKKLSDVALCLIWVNNDCEIATLDEKYLRLNGTIDTGTHEWHIADRPKLDALLQGADNGAREGIAFAEKAEVDSSVLAMIYERGSYLRTQTTDAAGLDALRQYWRCALLGNLCWQLAHTRKAQPVDLSAPDDKSKIPVAPIAGKAPAASTNAVAVAVPPLPPIAPIATNDGNKPVAPRALPVIDDSVSNAPPAPPAPTPTPAPPVATPAPAPAPPQAPSPVPTATAIVPPAANPEDNIPVAPIAKVQDYSTPPAVTNAAPVAPVINPAPPVPKQDNADAHSF